MSTRRRVVALHPYIRTIHYPIDSSAIVVEMLLRKKIAILGHVETEEVWVAPSKAGSDNGIRGAIQGCRREVVCIRGHTARIEEALVMQNPRNSRSSCCRRHCFRTATQAMSEGLAGTTSVIIESHELI